MNFAIVAMALFAIGLYGVLTRRDIIAVLACVEVMLGAAVLLLISLGTSALTESGRAVADTGSIEAIGVLLVILTAAGAAVGLALLVAIAKTAKKTRVDELKEVKG